MRYEFVGIIKPFLPEDVRIKLQEKIKKLFTEGGGKISSEDLWGKRHLAYKIKGHEEGYYVLYEIDITEEKISGIDKELRLMTDLLRFMIEGKD